MATYNGSAYLREQLNSFACQSQRPDELVVTDDGSTDHTMEILEEFARNVPFEVRIYQNCARLGYRDNFLHALELCKNDLVAFSDQDDVWLPNKLTACAHYFEAAEVALVTHFAKLVGPSLEPLGRTWPNSVRRRSREQRSWNILNNEFCGSVILFRKHVAKLLFTAPCLRNAFSGHDLAVGFLASASGRVVRSQEILSLHRCHGRNTSSGHEVRTAPMLSYINSVNGLGMRMSALRKWLEIHSNLALSTGGSSYLNQAGDMNERAEILLDVAAGAEGHLRSVLEESSRLLRKSARATMERSYLYGDASERARRQFCKMIIHGRYSPRAWGGLGLWSLAKDSRFLFQASRQNNKLQSASCEDQ